MRIVDSVWCSRRRVLGDCTSCADLIGALSSGRDSRDAFPLAWQEGGLFLGMGEAAHVMDGIGAPGAGRQLVPRWTIPLGSQSTERAEFMSVNLDVKRGGEQGECPVVPSLRCYRRRV